MALSSCARLIADRELMYLARAPRGRYQPQEAEIGPKAFLPMPNLFPESPTNELIATGH
jgi:hypothetical protein